VVGCRPRRDQGRSVRRGYEDTADTAGWWEYGISSVRSVVLAFTPEGSPPGHLCEPGPRRELIRHSTYEDPHHPFSSLGAKSHYGI
jgi:hypothetical protein